MSGEQIAAVLLSSAITAFLAYGIGCAVGKYRQQVLWRDHMDRCNRYISAVDDLDRWCGHYSPHASLISRHLKAIGEGTGHNAGTPCGDEACDIDGLRQQLARMDAAQRAAAQKEAND